MNKTPTTKDLEALTDDYGVWQHATEHSITKSEGYALDDVARALIVFLKYNKPDQARVCINYINDSIKDGAFIGFFNQEREPIVYPSSYDAAALAVLSICFAINANFEVTTCKNILGKIDFNIFDGSEHIRGFSYLVIANSLFKIERLEKYHELILPKFDKNNWFENKMTYANAIIPLALLEYYSKNQNEETLKTIIKTSIATLELHMRIGVIPAPIGNREHYVLGSMNRDVYGQQPIDAGFMVILMCRAYELFKEDIYLKSATEWLEWFYVNNVFKQSLIRDNSACCDGIDAHGLSTNYGSESTIIFLWASKVFNDVIKP